MYKSCIEVNYLQTNITNLGNLYYQLLIDVGEVEEEKKRFELLKITKKYLK